MKDDHQYMNEEYKNFLSSLKDLDKTYTSAKGLDQRVILAKNAISVWNDFVAAESDKLPKDEFFIREDIKIKLKELWDRFKVF
jgi:hypothetical protein